MEADFGWKLGDRAIGIEVKAARRWRPQDGRGLRHLLDSGVVSRAFGVYRGEDEMRDGDIRVLPVEGFLRALQGGEVIGERTS